MVERTSTRWLVVAGPVSPYTPALWDRVAALPGNEVLILSRTRRETTSFGHEKADGMVRHARWVQLQRFSLSQARASLREAPDVAVCLGHTRPADIALAAALRLRKATAVYMGDTNGYDGLEVPRGAVKRAGDALKRAVLARAFEWSFDLGRSNAIAHRRLGIRRGAEIPLYAVDYASLEAASTAFWREGRFAQLPRPRLLCVARLIDAKNLHRAVRAWREHVLAGGPGSLTLVGGGPLADELEALAASVPGRRALVAGPVERSAMGVVMEGADGLILPSLVEPWGIAVVEALGLGKPVLASVRVGSARSLAAECGDAVLLADIDEPSLAAGLARFVSELETRSALAKACASRVRKVYDINSVAAKLSEWGRRVRAERRA